ncbi:MAG: DUF4834 family protein [Bacteroidales bacterium]|nr:DUF4834 family protein [Bacteroidales bacterium]
MFRILFGILIILGLFLLLTGSFSVKVLRTLFGFGNKTPQKNQNEPTHTYSKPKNRNKIFGKHEGEYVEFEEIEEEEQEKE